MQHHREFHTLVPILRDPARRLPHPPASVHSRSSGQYRQVPTKLRKGLRDLDDSLWPVLYQLQHDRITIVFASRLASDSKYSVSCCTTGGSDAGSVLETSETKE
jgi:hypothetical protein